MSAPITLNGRLTADPEMRFSASGVAVAKFTIVTSRRTKNEQTNEWSDADTTFWDCVVFKQLAENVAETLQKGMDVVAVGRAVHENWEDKTTGAKRSKISVKVDSIGPSLTRATAKVVKAQSGQGQQGGGQQQGGQRQQPQAQDPWASSAPAQQGGGGWGAPAAGFADEPPF